MKKTNTTSLAPARLALTPAGFVSPRNASINSGHSYYMGASSSPSLVLVLAAGTEVVVYVDARDLQARRMDRWIFADMVSRGGETVRRDAERAEAAARSAVGFGSLALRQHMAYVARKNAALHGAPATFADYDRVQVEITGEGDVYGIASNLGCIVEYNGGQTITVEMPRTDLSHVVAAGFTQGSVRVIRACPTSP